ncbi:HAD hydrolase family protein [Paenibacillus sp. UNC451MF]|uniref:HAD hydrolase family protein n=1 Tax=Paenibacillus sp. UNC451MF TaxID=1449063 RepID=UPI0004902318|nr:HAD hydrolase family protein [Paenibacillus sp. UNC451MF]
MKTHYVVTDLDGTLLRSDAILSPFAKEAVNKALDQGIVMSYATARSYKSSTVVVGDVKWKYPMVLYNGALLFDPIEMKKLDGAFLSALLTDQVIRLGKTFGLSPLWFALDDHNEERVLHEPLQRKGELQFVASRPNDTRFRELPELIYSDQYQTLILTYIGPKEELEPLEKAIRNQFNDAVHLHFMPDNYIADHYFLEVSHPKANKRDGLLMWAKHMSCSPEDIVVFGDNLNDIGLFEAAGTKIAVANAQPELKAMADRTIESNSEDGVAKYVLGLLEA